MLIKKINPIVDTGWFQCARKITLFCIGQKEENVSRYSIQQQHELTLKATETHDYRGKNLRLALFYVT